MAPSFWKKAARWAAVLLALWLAGKYLLPLLIPFLLGALIALAAEPAVKLATKRFKWRRLPAVGVSVTMTLVLLTGVLYIAAALAVRQLGRAAQAVPEVTASVQQGMLVLEDYLVSLTEKTPESIRPVLTKTVLDTFDGGGALMEEVTGRLPGVMASVLGWLSQSFLTVGTAVLAAYLISARLPKLKSAVSAAVPEGWKTRVLPAVKRAKKTLGGWLKAQLKMASITFCVLTVGFLLLKVSYGPLWAALIAMVDAVPVLGTGTVLVPWALVRFLQGETVQGVGLLAVFALCWLLRTVLEPRVVGKQIGLDPLWTLAAFYVGFKVWGIPGMILAPMIAATVKGTLEKPDGRPFKNISQ